MEIENKETGYTLEKIEGVIDAYIRESTGAFKAIFWV